MLKNFAETYRKFQDNLQQSRLVQSKALDFAEDETSKPLFKEWFKSLDEREDGQHNIKKFKSTFNILPARKEPKIEVEL